MVVDPSREGRSVKASALLRDLFLPPRRFADTRSEGEFLRHYCERYCSHRRAAAVLGLITWALYSGWDAWHAQANVLFAQGFLLIISLRAAGAVVLCAALVLCLKPRFRV